MIKKLFVAVISLIVVFPLLVYADEQVKITFLWWPDPGGGFEEVIKDFEKENSDIRVEMIKGPTSTDTREMMYITGFLAGRSDYDMVLMDIVWLPKFAKQGWLVPLDEWFSKEEKSKFLPGDIEGSIYKGRTYRVPLQTDAGILYYRKDLLEAGEYASPKTWKEFIEIAGKLQNKPDIWGFVFQGKQYEGLICNFLEILWSFGGDVFDEEGNLVLNSQEGIEALKFMYDLVHTYQVTPEGVVTYEEEETRHIFQEGRAVFCRNWPYMWKLAQEENSPVKGKIGMSVLPSKKGIQSHSTLGGWGFGISKFSKNKEACIRFIEYITSYESQKKLHFKSGIVPTRRALFKDKDILKQNPFYSDLYKILLSAKPRPVHPDYSQVSDVLRRFVHRVLLGELSAEKALESAESEIEGILRK